VTGDSTPSAAGRQGALQPSNRLNATIYGSFSRLLESGRPDLTNVFSWRSVKLFENFVDHGIVAYEPRQW